MHSSFNLAPSVISYCKVFDKLCLRITSCHKLSYLRQLSRNICKHAVKTSGGIGMFFFLRWISKLHYKIHHNITKKYIWIYMQKTVSRQVRLQQASETRNGMVRRTLQTPPSQSHFRVTFNVLCWFTMK